MQFTPQLIGLCLAQLALTAAICANARKLGQALGLVDDPRLKAHALHQRVTPLVGGLAVLCPWLIGIELAFWILPDPGLAQLRGVLPPLLTGFIALLMILGALDDRFHLSARSRLWIKLIAAFALVVFESQLQITALNFPGAQFFLSLGILAPFFTVLCLAALTNAVNMTDGRNGLVIGMCCIWLGTLLLRLPSLAHPLLYALLAALVVVGWFNWRGRLFLGDAGSYGLSSLIGVLAIWAHNQAPEAGGLTSSQLASFFMIPALDMFRLIVVRTMRGVSCMAADNDHLHHRLDRCCGWNKGILIYLGVVALPVAVALGGPKSGLIGMTLGFALYLLVWFGTRRAMLEPTRQSVTVGQ